TRSRARSSYETLDVLEELCIVRARRRAPEIPLRHPGETLVRLERSIRSLNFDFHVARGRVSIPVQVDLDFCLARCASGGRRVGERLYENITSISVGDEPRGAVRIQLLVARTSRPGIEGDPCASVDVAHAPERGKWPAPESPVSRRKERNP